VTTSGTRRPRVPQDKTFKCGRLLGGIYYGAELTTFSPPRGTTWDGLFGIRFKDVGPVHGHTMLTARTARELAADLLRRADDLDARAGEFE